MTALFAEHMRAHYSELPHVENPVWERVIVLGLDHNLHGDPLWICLGGDGTTWRAEFGNVVFDWRFVEILKATDTEPAQWGWRDLEELVTTEGVESS